MRATRVSERSRAHGLRSGRAFLYETLRELPHSLTWSEALSDDLKARSQYTNLLCQSAHIRDF
jgi:hypothetical protein